ncbi:EexN family lipoprotein [Ochrobactrum vermis]|uniref:EexN family lipoprotein n=1 Tax=Ochrobactrum vermis TaxID=1827297 RepID=A0ABU8PFY4_9HYPH|nr:EexN family lipoprotein [Ochrobactrum vermis]PQZ25561.1 hypothetical protein CQZ93_15985 [Ochrobactrum vermis]
MRVLVTMVVLLVVTGCSEEKITTYSVEELTADETLLVRVLSECRNDPGNQRDTARCVNAETTDGKRRLRKMRELLGN